MGDSEIVTALGKKKRVIEDDAEEAPVAKKTKVKETELPKPIVQVAPIQAPIEEVKGDDQM
jgi:DNA-directed RNA polymerase subunit H (RpoH/RPB5)